jgi:phosphomevalonate kinase
VFAVFVVIGAITLYEQFVTPHMNYFHATQEYALVMGDIAKKTNTIRVVTELKKKKLEELQDKFKDIHAKLFNPVEAEEFFSDIQAIAEQANCIVYSLNFSPINTATKKTVKSKVTKNISENCVTLTVGGSYTDIVNLINSLQNRPKQVWTDSITIEAIGNSDVLKCELNIRIYVIYDKWRQRND